MSHSPFCKHKNCHCRQVLTLQEVPDFHHFAGLKRISSFSSICIITNTIAGPGMVVLPRIFQEAGWVIPTMVFILILVASSLAATFLCDTMARIPGNSRFERRIEFVNIFDVSMWVLHSRWLLLGHFETAASRDKRRSSALWKWALRS